MRHDRTNPRQTGPARSDHQGRTPPANVDFERSVLGGIFLDPEMLPEVRETVSVDDFFLDGHRKILTAIYDLADADQSAPIDLFTVSEALQRRQWLDMVGGDEYLLELNRYVPSAANIGYYCREIRQKALLRAMIHASNASISEAYDQVGDVDELLDTAERRLMDLRDVGSGGIGSAADTVSSTLDLIEYRYQHRNELPGITAGLPDLDAATGGWQPEELYVLAARPAMGKTTLAMQLALTAAKTGKRVLVYSLEMPSQQLMLRLISAEGRVDFGRLRRGDLRATDWPKMITAVNTIKGVGDGVRCPLPLWIDDASDQSIEGIRSKTRRLARDVRTGVDLVVIDYIQQMVSDKRSERREEEVARISRGLKQMAKELKLPVIALSQLNRGLEARTDKRPCLADLRESGAIEQDADMVLFLFREAVYNREADPKAAELIVGKNRHGEPGVVPLYFEGRYCQFASVERHRDPGEVAPWEN